MGRTGETYLSTETRPKVMDASPLRQQRPLHLLPNQDRLLTLRQLMLRLGGSAQRAKASTRFLVIGRSTTSHHLEGVEGCATRNPIVPTGSARTTSTNAPLHEDNQAVVALLSHFTSRSAAMMDETRKLWELVDNNYINTRARHIRSAADV
jgi:hypothetical protein